MAAFAIGRSVSQETAATSPRSLRFAALSAYGGVTCLYRKGARTRAKKGVRTRARNDKALYLHKHLLSIHPAEDEEEDEGVAEGQPCRVVCAQEGFEAVAHTADDGPEVDDLAQHVGHYGVHAIDFQPFQSAAMIQHVHPTIEGGEEQEAIARREERHATRPDALDDGHLKAPQPSCDDKDGADDGQCQACAAGALTTAADNLPRHGAQHHRHAEGQTRQQPGVGGVALKAAQHDGINAARQIALEREIAAERHG